MSINLWKERIPKDVINLLQELNAAGYSAWLVGGCVRDMLLGIIPTDYDVATSALPTQVCELFPKCIETGIMHGTVTVVMAHTQIETTTYRSEGKYSDGRRPDIVHYEKDILPDLERRDFTINSMAWHPQKGFLDPFAGREHLRKRELRCVGPAEKRLTEDALRQLRAVRFALTYNLKPDQELLVAISKHYRATDCLSAERIQTELQRIGRAQYSHMIEIFAGTKLMAGMYEKLFDLQVDDPIVCRLLAGHIQPFWQQEQIWSVLLLAGLHAGSITELPQETEGRIRLPLEHWLNLARDLTAYKKKEKVAVFVKKIRLSAQLASKIQAVLLFIGLRLLLAANELKRETAIPVNGSVISYDIFLQNQGRVEEQGQRRLRLLLRNVARHCRLKHEQVVIACIRAVEIMTVLIDDRAFTASLQKEKSLLMTWRSFPDEYMLQVSQLPLRGDDVVFKGLKNKRQVGVLLERLLSLQINSKEKIREEELREIAAGWLAKFL